MSAENCADGDRGDYGQDGWIDGRPQLKKEISISQLLAAVTTVRGKVLGKGGLSCEDSSRAWVAGPASRDTSTLWEEH